MGLNSSTILQWVSHDYLDQKPAGVLSSDQGEKQNPLMGALATKQHNTGLIWQSKPQKQLAKRSQYRRSLSFEEEKNC